LYGIEWVFYPVQHFIHQLVATIILGEVAGQLLLFTLSIKLIFMVRLIRSFHLHILIAAAVLAGYMSSVYVLF